MTARRLGIGAALVAFLVVSALVARWLGADAAERTKVERLLEAQVRGDAAGMQSEVLACEPDCATLARRLKRPGEFQVVRYDSGTEHSLGAAREPTRVVWRTTRSLTVVQCVEVRRTGWPADRRVTLLRLGGPIEREGSC